MIYPEHVIEEIREQSDIVSIISEYTALNKKGSSYVGLCPFHNEKTPSFSVSEDKQLYYCFGCGAGGNVITFLMQKENMSFIEVIKYLAERENIKLDETYLSQEEVENNKKRGLLLDILKESARYFHYSLRAPENEEALKYLLDRGLTMETIKHFGLGYANHQFNDLYEYLKQKGYSDELLLESGLFLQGKQNNRMIYDRFAGRIIYPIFDLSKKVIAFGGRVLDGSLPKYLNSPENMLFNKSRQLYGMHIAKNSGAPYFILVEGYMDVIAMHQAGFSQTVASLGTAFTPGHAKLLKRHTKEVVILYDSDGAGQKAALRAIPILRSEGLKVKVLLLQEGKDPDEYLKTHGYEAMKALLEGAPSDIWFQIHTIEKQYDLSVPEEKVKFLQQSAGVLAEKSSSIEQAIYLKEISKAYEIDEEAFKAEMNRYYQQGKSQRVARSMAETTTRQKKQVFNNEVIFLANLYHYPNLGRHVQAYLRPEFFDEGLLYDLAKAILESLKSNQEIDMTYFTTHYPEAVEQNIISHVLIHKDQRYEDVALLQKMMTENVRRLNKQYIEKRLKETQDVQEVQNLLFQKKELDKLNIDYING
ncbi:MAG: DNA primase [Cellulosilyticum sp.]|nr:DNA primase [Cellulosilyticum sp.]